MEFVTADTNLQNSTINDVILVCFASFFMSIPEFTAGEKSLLLINKQGKLESIAFFVI